MGTSLSDGIHTLVAKQMNPTTGATSGPSSTLSITIDTSATVRPTPIASSDITQTSARISWSPVTDAVIYMMYRNNTLITSTEQTALADSGLAANTQYTYFISTKDIA